jgi:hypothetical protein
VVLLILAWWWFWPAPRNTTHNLDTRMPRMDCVAIKEL